MVFVNLAGLVLAAVVAYGSYRPQSFLGRSNRELQVVERRVYAIADLHGDYAGTISALSNANVISKDGREWLAGNATLVQTGDITDRGADTRKLYEWFRTLDGLARDDGGQVIHLLGNHEFMNAMGDWRYVSEEDIQAFPKPHRKSREIEFSSAGTIGQDFLQNYQISYKDPIGAHFIHAGLPLEWSETDINKVGHEFMASLLEGNHNQSEWTHLQDAFYSPSGPLWYRGYATQPDSIACREAAEVLEKLDSDMLIMGHTPHFNSVISRCNNSILLIDTGLSYAYGGRAAVLELTKLRDDPDIHINVHYNNEAVTLSKQ